jgi:hypothetical protein
MPVVHAERKSMCYASGGSVGVATNGKAAIADEG